VQAILPLINICTRLVVDLLIFGTHMGGISN
jgi:hypothetical protein